MSNKCTLKAFLELKPRLSPFPMNLFHLMMCSLKTHAALSDSWRMTADNSTDHIVMGIPGAIAMSIILKRDLATMNCTSWAADGDSINNNNPNFFPIFVNS